MSAEMKKMKVYEKVAAKYPDVLSALERLGDTIRNVGPIDAKHSQLIQLAAAAATQSEGSVHSHTRRALQAGAAPEEIEHAILMLISVIGFPKVAAALSWAYDHLEGGGS